MCFFFLLNKYWLNYSRLCLRPYWDSQRIFTHDKSKSEIDSQLRRKRFHEGCYWRHGKSGKIAKGKKLHCFHHILFEKMVRRNVSAVFFQFCNDLFKFQFLLKMILVFLERNPWSGQRTSKRLSSMTMKQKKAQR